MAGLTFGKVMITVDETDESKVSLDEAVVDQDFMQKALKMHLTSAVIVEVLKRTSKPDGFDYEAAAAQIIKIAHKHAREAEERKVAEEEAEQPAALRPEPPAKRSTPEPKRRKGSEGAREREPERPAPAVKPEPKAQPAGASKLAPGVQYVYLKEMVQHGVLRPGARRARRAPARAPARSSRVPSRQRARTSGPYVSVQLNLKGTAIRASGTLSEAGQLVDSEDGIAYDSPSGWAKACIEKSGLVGKTNGWKAVLYEGKPLDSFR